MRCPACYTTLLEFKSHGTCGECGSFFKNGWGKIYGEYGGKRYVGFIDHYENLIELSIYEIDILNEPHYLFIIPHEPSITQKTFSDKLALLLVFR